MNEQVCYAAEAPAESPLLGKLVTLAGTGRKEVDGCLAFASAYNAGRYSLIRLPQRAIGPLHDDTVFRIDMATGPLQLKPLHLAPLAAAAEPFNAELRERIPAMAGHMLSEFQTKSEIKVGAKVVLLGLVAKKELNGSYGIVRAFDASSGRFLVVLDNDEAFKLKPDNLATCSGEGGLYITKADFLDVVSGKARQSLIGMVQETEKIRCAVVGALAAAD